MIYSSEVRLELEGELRTDEATGVATGTSRIEAKSTLVVCIAVDVEHSDVGVGAQVVAEVNGVEPDVRIGTDVVVEPSVLVGQSSHPTIAQVVVETDLEGGDIIISADWAGDEVLDTAKEFTLTVDLESSAGLEPHHGVEAFDVGWVPPGADSTPVAVGAEVVLDAAVTTLDAPVIRGVTESNVISDIVVIGGRAVVFLQSGLSIGAVDVDVAKSEIGFAAEDFLSVERACTERSQGVAILPHVGKVEATHVTDWELELKTEGLIDRTVTKEHRVDFNTVDRGDGAVSTTEDEQAGLTEVEAELGAVEAILTVSSSSVLEVVLGEVGSLPQVVAYGVGNAADFCAECLTNEAAVESDGELVDVHVAVCVNERSTVVGAVVAKQVELVTKNDNGVSLRPGFVGRLEIESPVVADVHISGCANRKTGVATVEVTDTNEGAVWQDAKSVVAGMTHKSNEVHVAVNVDCWLSGFEGLDSSLVIVEGLEDVVNLNAKVGELALEFLGESLKVADGLAPALHTVDFILKSGELVAQILDAIRAGTLDHLFKSLDLVVYAVEHCQDLLKAGVGRCSEFVAGHHPRAAEEAIFVTYEAATILKILDSLVSPVIPIRIRERS